MSNREMATQEQIDAKRASIEETELLYKQSHLPAEIIAAKLMVPRYELELMAGRR